MALHVRGRPLRPLVAAVGRHGGARAQASAAAPAWGPAGTRGREGREAGACVRGAWAPRARRVCCRPHTPVALPAWSAAGAAAHRWAEAHDPHSCAHLSARTPWPPLPCAPAKPLFRPASPLPHAPAPRSPHHFNPLVPRLRRSRSQGWTLYKVILAVLTVTALKMTAYTLWVTSVTLQSRLSLVSGLYYLYIPFKEAAQAAFLGLLLLLASGFCITRADMGQHKSKVYGIPAIWFVTGVVTDVLYYKVCVFGGWRRAWCMWRASEWPGGMPCRRHALASPRPARACAPTRTSPWALPHTFASPSLLPPVHGHCLPGGGLSGHGPLGGGALVCVHAAQPGMLHAGLGLRV